MERRFLSESPEASGDFYQTTRNTDPLIRRKCDLCHAMSNLLSVLNGEKKKVYQRGKSF